MSAKMTKLITVLMIFLHLFSRCVSASDLDNMYAEALNGNARTGLLLGNAYQAGNGVRMNMVEAAFWYRQAAILGNHQAQNSLGSMYANGLGVSQSDTLAVSWFQKAADAGDVDGQFNLGLFYETGRGVVKNPEKAVLLYSKSAQNGHSDAFLNLAVMYLTGDGLKQDSVLAYAYMQISSKLNNVTAKRHMLETENWKHILTDKQRDDANVIAKEWRIGVPLPKGNASGNQIKFATVEGGDLITINGEIKPGAFAEFSKKLSKSTQIIKINSSGGDAFEAIEIGEVIRDRRIHVVVDGECLSSCANYIFASAKNKTIKENSIVCFHGGLPKNEREYIDMYLDQNGFPENADLHAAWKNMTSYVQREKELIDSSGIDPTVLDAKLKIKIPNFSYQGTGEAPSEFLKRKTGMWCPDQEGFKRAGILVNEMWYPKDDYALLALGERFSENLVAARDRERP